MFSIFSISVEHYREFNAADDWQQGDIVEDLYTTRVIEDDMYIYRPPPQQSLCVSELAELASVNKGVAPPFSKSNRENAVIPVFKTDVMIVSQTCDILHDRQVTVARVYPFNHSYARANTELQENIRHGNAMSAFYLPDYPVTNDESFANLAELTVISKELLNGHREQRKRSLSPEGLQIFQSFVERFFCREAMPDDVSKIIITFYRRLKESQVGSKIDRIYYDYSCENISLLVALDDDDEKGQESVEAAKEYIDQSIKHRYEIQVECKAKDRIMLREIEGFREFR